MKWAVFVVGLSIVGVGTQLLNGNPRFACAEIVALMLVLNYLIYRSERTRERSRTDAMECNDAAPPHVGGNVRRGGGS